MKRTVHDLEVWGLNPSLVELQVRSTYITTVIKTYCWMHGKNAFYGKLKVYLQNNDYNNYAGYC